MELPEHFAVRNFHRNGDFHCGTVDRREQTQQGCVSSRDFQHIAVRYFPIHKDIEAFDIINGQAFFKKAKTGVCELIFYTGEEPQPRIRTQLSTVLFCTVTQGSKVDPARLGLSTATMKPYSALVSHPAEETKLRKGT